MRRAKWFLILGFVCWSLKSFVLAEEKATDKMSKEIPIEVQLFNTAILKSFPDIDKNVEYFSWPSAEKISVCLRQSDEAIAIAEKKMVIPKWMSTEKGTVTEAKRVAEKWVRTILKDRWIPPDIYNKLIALDSDIEGCDSIRVRYEIDGWYIQIVQTNHKIAITVRPVREKSILTEEVIDLFFVRSNEIKKNSFYRIETFSGGLRGVPPHPVKNPDGNQYWGHTYWWTNDKSFAFLILKHYGGAAEPGVLKDWF